ncbi:MAG: hypothetical protein CO114_00630 [Euryarchaeota archaeon CG_4_9_14_3_um_filter_38_12]|nr:MAG: hypothetical protein CO114_00630 [Euryarchaeota archaeon CG_4_9_14_3_um_filter_38_12]
MSRRQKILRCLIDNIEPVPNYILQSVEVGGVSGLRRLRELRDRGIKIEVRRKNKLMVKNGKWISKPTGTFYYKLLTPPNMIDIPNCRLKKEMNDRNR